MEILGNEFDIMELIKEAEKGDSSAVEALTMARALSDELSSNADFEKLLHKYYKRMAARGDGNALLYIAQDYERGKTVPQNIHKAIEYCELAVGRGKRTGYEFIAEMYMNGKSLPVNYKKAYKYLMKSLYFKGERGSLTSDIGYYLLAELYFFGLYVNKDLELAKEYYSEVVAMGFDYGESYYWCSNYRIGQIYEQLGDDVNAEKYKNRGMEFYNWEDDLDSVAIEDLLTRYP
ncbi:tetratricopeptide repeat protein [Butyrivibrio sp. CB08]|uniref:tetratricopeptide repeat protein n=1 Tax=Butyrivibrio sp. CB08 TaxID=2364879 RepID=UPI0013141B32|nr:tetratricopeptide repeat protein [Butyrivibrio sp. CB08]